MKQFDYKEFLKEFHLDTSRWKKRVEGQEKEEDKQEIIFTLSKHLLNTFSSVNEEAGTISSEAHSSLMFNTFLAMASIARSVVRASDGIRKGYRLHDQWVGILFAQVMITAAQELDELDPMGIRTENIKRKIQPLYTHLGWDYELACNPTPTATWSTIECTIQTGELSDITFKLVIVPSESNKFPLGSTWEWEGDSYTCLGEEGVNVLMEEQKPSRYRINKETRKRDYYYADPIKVNIKIIGITGWKRVDK